MGRESHPWSIGLTILYPDVIVPQYLSRHKASLIYHSCDHSPTQNLAASGCSPQTKTIEQDPKCRNDLLNRSSNQSTNGYINISI